MNRLTFLKNSLLGVGAVATMPGSLFSSKNEHNEEITAEKSISQLIKENIVGDREGVALKMNLTFLQKNNSQKPLKNAIVDVWHCDANGEYSKHDGEVMNASEYTKRNFLRGRQYTDEKGQISFVSIFPGWYTGRAPHIHVQVSTAEGKVLYSNQMGLPKEACDAVYKTDAYPGLADTTNEHDELISLNLKENTIDSVSGNPSDGYILESVITV